MDSLWKQLQRIPSCPSTTLHAPSLLARGATIQADSSYPGGNSPEVAIDGVWETTGLHWTKKAWALSGCGIGRRALAGDHIALADACSAGVDYWAIDNERVFSSRNYDIELWEEQAWRSVAQIRDNPLSTVTISSWPAQTTQRVRIRQLMGGGPQSRPHIMWIAEIFLLGPLKACFCESGFLKRAHIRIFEISRKKKRLKISALLERSSKRHQEPLLMQAYCGAG